MAKLQKLLGTADAVDAIKETTKTARMMKHENIFPKIFFSALNVVIFAPLWIVDCRLLIYGNRSLNVKIGLHAFVLFFPISTFQFQISSRKRLQFIESGRSAFLKIELLVPV